MKSKDIKVCPQCGYSDKMYKRKIVNTVLLILLIVLMGIIATKITQQELKKPFGYYDGTYICVNEEDYKNNMTPKQLIEDHEYCHSLVRSQYDHFCSKGGFESVFN